MWLTIIKLVAGNWKAIVGGVIIIAAFGFGWYTNGNRMQLKIDALTSAINAADAVAKSQVKINEENLHAIQVKADSDAAAIKRYYGKLLYTQNTTRPVTEHPCEANGTSQEQADARLDFEQRCVQDAATVGEFQEWVLRNNIPVE